MAKTEQNHDPEPPAEPATTGAASDKPKTLWDKHSGLLIVLITIGIVVLLLAFNMNCPGSAPK